MKTYSNLATSHYIINWRLNFSGYFEFFEMNAKNEIFLKIGGRGGPARPVTLSIRKLLPKYFLFTKYGGGVTTQLQSCYLVKIVLLSMNKINQYLSIIY